MQADGLATSKLPSGVHISRANFCLSLTVLPKYVNECIKKEAVNTQVSNDTQSSRQLCYSTRVGVGNWGVHALLKGISAQPSD